jgi:hypothetical protein
MWQKIKGWFNIIVNLIYFFVISTSEPKDVNNNEKKCSICFDDKQISVDKLDQIKSDVFCTDDNILNNNFSTFSCDHIDEFHRKCIWKWICKNSNLTLDSITSCNLNNPYFVSYCPLCRQPIITTINGS